MPKINIFISVGATANQRQEDFVSALEKKLDSEDLIPNTVGRNKFSADAPLKAVMEVMDDCSGAIIVALERLYFPNGIEKRGGPKEKPLVGCKIATPWNQIEAAMAYAKGQPLFVIREQGVTSEGLLEQGYDWYVMNVELDPAVFDTPEFKGVISSWKEKVKSFHGKKKGKR
jgi:hypothetical protein